MRVRILVLRLSKLLMKLKLKNTRNNSKLFKRTHKLQTASVMSPQKTCLKPFEAMKKMAGNTEVEDPSLRSSYSSSGKYENDKKIGCTEQP